MGIPVNTAINVKLCSTAFSDTIHEGVALWHLNIQHITDWPSMYTDPVATRPGPPHEVLSCLDPVLSEVL